MSLSDYKADERTTKETIDRCHKVAVLLGFYHPTFTVIHSRIRDMYRIVTVPIKPGHKNFTACVNTKGRITINTEWIKRLTNEQLGGILAHEMLHIVMNHNCRYPHNVDKRKEKIFNIAADMCMNKALREDNIQLPPSVFFPPDNYKGELSAEALYAWLLENPQKDVEDAAKSKEDSDFGQGCGMDDDGDDMDDVGEERDETYWKHVAATARAVGNGGKSGHILDLLSPKNHAVNWRQILRSTFSTAAARAGKDYQTYTKRHRRSPTQGVQMAGWRGKGVRVAISVDVSGSMTDPKWLSAIHGEIVNLLTLYPGSKCYLNAHTCEVVWSGWVDSNTKSKIKKALSYSGGTDPTPAYEDIEKAGKFHTLCHFTDGLFGTSQWPVCPCPQLIVGIFGSKCGGYTNPPPGAVVIPCDVSI